MRTGGGYSVFDTITPDDLIIAFFPCIYFTGSTNPCYFRLENINYKCLSLEEKLNTILDRARKREHFYEILYKLVGTCLKRNFKIIFENPFDSQHFLYNNFLKNPNFIDKNRQKRGDYFKKPTGYWFFNCENTYGESFQDDKEHKKIWDMKRGKGGLCSKERSMIHPDYARNFICDFILGKTQFNLQQGKLF